MTGIQLDETTLDLKVKGGALSIGSTSEQNQALILEAYKGEWKENPLLGVGIGDYTNDNETALLKHTIRENFSMDGITVQSINISHGKININADYNN